MTAPVPARDHANMTVAEREFTFDSLLAEFGEPEAPVVSGAKDMPGPAPLVAAGVAAPQKRRVPDAAAVGSSPVKRRAARKPRSASRSFARPSSDVLQLGGLVVVAGISLTLAFVALSR